MAACRSGGPYANRHPPPPAPHTLAAVAPAAIARSISESIAGVVTPGASRLRLSHSSAIARPTASQSALVSASRMIAAVSRIRSKQSKTNASPSMCFFVISQLFVPELRGRCSRERCAARGREHRP
jgi:hypothetical protein